MACRLVDVYNQRQMDPLDPSAPLPAAPELTELFEDGCFLAARDHAGLAEMLGEHALHAQAE